MMQLVHGGDWAGYRAQYGQDALDLSANVSPLGLPEGVAKAITAALATADRYPDPLCRALRAKLAVHEKEPMEHILCGNGAADLIFRLVWAAKPRTALLPAPTFAEYAAALETAGCTVRRHFLQEKEDFAMTEAFISAVDEHTDMVFLCQLHDQMSGSYQCLLVCECDIFSRLDCLDRRTDSDHTNDCCHNKFRWLICSDRNQSIHTINDLTIKIRQGNP